MIFKTIWNKIIEFLFFHKKRETIEIKHNKRIEDRIEEMLLDNQIVNCSSKQKELLQSLKPGDLVYSKMPLSEDELKLIGKKHAHRPYFVLKVLENSIIAFSCSSSSHKWNEKSYYVIPANYYSNKKNNHIYFGKVVQLTPNCIFNHLDCVNEHDFIDIQKKAYIYQPSYKRILSLSNKDYSKGDILYDHKNLYYVNSKQNNGLQCYYVSTDASYVNEDVIQIPSKKYSYHIDTKIERILPFSMELELIDRLPVSSIQYIELKINPTPVVIKEKKKKVQSQPHCWQRYPMGTIFIEKYSQEEIVYLYSIHDRDYGMYAEEYLNTEEYNDVQIKRLDLSLCIEDGTICDEDLLDILQYQIENKHGQYQYLQSVIKSL